MKFKIMKNHEGYFIKIKWFYVFWLTHSDIYGIPFYFDTIEEAESEIVSIKEESKPATLIKRLK